MRLRDWFVNDTEVVCGQKEGSIGGSEVSLEKNMCTLRGIDHNLIYLIENLAGMRSVLYHSYRALLSAM